MARKVIDILEIIIYLFLIGLAIFIIYQLIRKILGGSWETPDIMVALLIMTIGIVFNTALKLSKVETRLNNLSKGFHCLAGDFKSHINHSKLI